MCEYSCLSDAIRCLIHAPKTCHHFQGVENELSLAGPALQEGEIMTSFARIIPVALILLTVCALAQQSDLQTPARGKRIVIAASALLDGKGHVSRNTRIVIE